MREFIVEGNNRSRIIIGSCVSRLQTFLPDCRVIAITDKNVKALYSQYLESFEVIVFPPGEANKTLSTVEKIYHELKHLEADRSTFILGFGGGLVCDIAGYVASTFMRGLQFGFVSTTLLSQVDASVGGKNGINFSGTKNMIGTFNQPEFVLCDPLFLKTLPEREIRSGFGEIIKHALIADSAMVKFLENKHTESLSLHAEAIEHLVLSSVKIKASIVNRDETEKGERRKLNFGHTLGHAIESLSGLSHGEAIAIGMVLASKVSQSIGLLSTEDHQRIKNLIDKYGLPITWNIERNLIFDQIINDKKRDGNIIHFVLLKNIGEAIIRKIKLSELKETG